MSGWIAFSILGGLGLLAAACFWASCAFNQVEKHLDAKAKEVRKKRLTLEAEMEIAYWHHRRDNH